MELDKHMVILANPEVVATFHRLVPKQERSNWIRERIAEEHGAWRRGAKQPQPIGEYRGTRANRQTITIRCSDDDQRLASELAAARRVSVSKMVRDMIARASEKSA
jgi:hypothetical protein